MGKVCALLFALVLLCSAGAYCYAHESFEMKTSFNLEHDTATATVTLSPSVHAGQDVTLDYRIKVKKQGVAGTSSEGHGGRVELLAGKDVKLGPVLRFGSFASQDSLQVELRLCRIGSRCKHPDDVLASFNSSYPDADGEKQ